MLKKNFYYSFFLFKIYQLFNFIKEIQKKKIKLYVFIELIINFLFFKLKTLKKKFFKQKEKYISKKY